MSEKQVLKPKEYVFPHGAYVILAEDPTAKDYKVTYKGEFVPDVIALVRVGK